VSDFLNQPLFWLYLTLYSGLVLATLLHMLYRQRSPQSLMAWLLTLLLLPYIGVILYLVFGTRKFFAKRTKGRIELSPEKALTTDHWLTQQTDHILRANNLSGTSEHNHIQVLNDNTHLYDAFLTAIEEAQQSIYIETYIFELDQTGQTILQALTKKAQQGLEVCLLLDGIGSYNLYTNQSKLKALIQQGGKVAFFHPVIGSLFKGQINLRNHRKIYLFDTHTLLTGGMNLSNNYLGPSQSSDSHHWKEFMLKISGTANAHYAKIFAEDWRYATGQPLTVNHAQDAYVNNTTHAQQVLQTVPSGPDIEGEPLFEVLLHKLYSAKQSIQIVTPYFIPDSSVLNALLIALKRGVKVQLLTPETSDHFIFDLGRSSYTRDLAEAGAEVFYYTDSMLHAKLLIIDQEAMISGSANLDYRSIYINYEVVNIIYSTDIIKETQDWIAQLKPNCIHFTPTQSKTRRLLENLTRIIAPIL